MSEIEARDGTVVSLTANQDGTYTIKLNQEDGLVQDGYTVLVWDQLMGLIVTGLRSDDFTELRNVVTETDIGLPPEYRAE